MKPFIKRVTALLMAAVLFCAAAVPAMAVEPTYRMTRAFTGSRYYEKFSEVELTGNYRADLINIALSQTGYHEGGCDADRDGMNLTSDGNWTEYGYYCECDGFAWCAMFVSWCARQARIPKSVIDDSRVARAPWFGVDFEYKEDYTPVPGDIIFFINPGEEWSHVGIVTAVDENGVWTVEGNSRDQVRVKFYEFDNDYIKGYGLYDSEPCTPELIKRDPLYKLQFDLNGGEGKRRDQYTLGDAPIVLYANAPDEVGDDDEFLEEPEHNDWCWKDGCDFMGWYLRRDSDGFWLTEKNGWRSGTEIVTYKYSRRIYADESAVTIENEWGASEGDTYTCYAVWKNQKNGKLEDDTAFVSNTDSKGWVNVFYDLREGEPYYNAAKNMISRGLINGVADSKFGPDGSLTRAQFLTMLYRYDRGIVAATEVPYSDVKPGDWFYDAVLWAWDNAITPATETLKPDTALTREEAVQYLYNYALLKGKAEVISDKDITLDIVRTLLTFSDISLLSPSYLEAVLWTYGSEILLPVEVEGRSMLRPKNIVTRAEACVMLDAWMNLK